MGELDKSDDQDSAASNRRTALYKIIGALISIALVVFFWPEIDDFIGLTEFVFGASSRPAPGP
jgi:hypothetical protein